MQILKTSKQVTQAVKNVQRLRTIVSVFGRHGLEEFLIRMGLEKYLPTTRKAEGVEHLSVPERLRMAFESLGPTFVKLGQLLSNRPDMIPENFIEEFKKLQDNVAPLPFSVMQSHIEKELGGELNSFFSYFNEAPLASASIGQVYEAKLLSGEEVVVKVQRPEIDKIIKNDISILSFLAGLMEKYLPEMKMIGPVQVVEEFFMVLTYELDFVIEASTTKRMSENFRDFTQVRIPKVYSNLSTSKVLTLERFRGVRVTDFSALKANGISPKDIVDIGARAFFKMVLQDGLFHGDLHGGNLFAMKDPTTGETQIGVIDFGVVGRLSQKSRDTFSRMMFALMTEDYETLCYEYAELGAVGTGIDFDGFQREVRNSLAPYMGLALKDVNMGLVLINSTRTALKHNIKIPSDWMIVFKAIFTLEGLGRQLDPDFDLMTIGNDLVKVLIKDRYSIPRLSKDFAWIARDISALIQVAPRQIRWMFKKFNSNDFAIEIKFKEMEVLRRQLEKGYDVMAAAILCGAFFIASAISLRMEAKHLVWDTYPLPSLVFFGMGTIGFVRLILRKHR